MALPATEDFAYSGSSALGANWTIQINTPQRSTDSACSGGGGVENAAFWNADAFNDNQYSKASFLTDNYPAVMVRASGTGSGAWNAYVLFGATGASIQKYVNGSATSLQSLSGGSAVVAARLEISGSTLKAFFAGAQAGTDQSDGSLSSGAAGVLVYSTTGKLDDWEGGNMAPPPAVFPLSRRSLHHYRRDVFRRRSV